MLSTPSHISVASTPLGTVQSFLDTTTTAPSDSGGFFRQIESISKHGLSLYRKFEKKQQEAHEKKARLTFLKDCLEEQVLPNSIPASVNASDLPFPPADRLAVNERITILKREIDPAFRKADKAENEYKTHFSSLPHIEPHIQHDLHDIAVRTLDNHMSEHRRQLQKKLLQAIERSAWTTNSLVDNVVNLSKVDLTVDHKRALGYGLSFNQKARAPTMVSAITDMLQTTGSHQDDEYLKGVLSHGFLDIVDGDETLPRRFRRALEDLHRRRDIKIMEADKGGRIVIVDTEDYIKAGLEMLSDKKVYKSLKSNNPLQYRVDKFNKSLENIINNKLPVGCKTLQRFIIKHPSEQKLPHLYGKPKIHKSHPPLKYRPIVSQFKTYNSNLTKFVAKILGPFVGTFSDAHLKDTHDFTSRLYTFYRNNPHLLSAPLLSLDVEALFTNVPLKPTLEFLERKLSNRDDLDLPEGITVSVLIELIELCCKSTVFSFNGSFYQQIDGVAMGSPLACLLANIYMEYFETELRSKLRLQPSFWWRFVDDIICIWPHGQDTFQTFLNGLNRLAPSINFTVEWEILQEDNGLAKLPFLDTLIHRSPLGIKFSVYRKPTHCHMYIHYFSYHAPSLKKGVLSGLFLRALRISSPCFLQAELDILWAAFRSLGYPNFYINKSFSMAKSTLRKQSHSISTPNPLHTPAPTSPTSTNTQPTSTPSTPSSTITNPPNASAPTSNPSTPSPPDTNPLTSTSDSPSTTTTSSTSSDRSIRNKKLILVPYSERFDQLKKYLHGTNYKLAFTYRNTTRHKVAKNLCSASVPPKLHGGVYLCTCKDCDLTYYGRTSRPFEVRLAEHMNAVEEGNPNSSLVKHMETHPGHEFDFAAAKLLWKSTNVLESKYVESSCIQTLPNCNTQAGEVTVNPILASMIMKVTNISKLA